MMILEGTNVNSIFARAVTELMAKGRLEKSRAGDVLVLPYPAMSIYAHPMQRVLLDPARDANPFFHLFESLWMLGGRGDAEFLNQFVGDFGSRFAEPDGAIHGAYGYRWRGALGFDQLDAAVERLTADPDTRQVVIQMWDADSTGQKDLTGDWRDRPCNTHIYLRVREGVVSTKVLDLTVCCRSNDIIWGAYGANAVHFSVLQEYLAGRVGVGVGLMYQLSNNWHGYVAPMHKYMQACLDYDWRALTDPDVDGRDEDPYHSGTVRARPIGDDWNRWDEDNELFLEWVDQSSEEMAPPIEYFNKWFKEVAEPMYAAHLRYRQGDKRGALAVAREQVLASDWSRAAAEWIERRIR